MQKNIILTGLPRSGKSTLIRKIIDKAPHKVGFVTNEILKENSRVGFEIETSRHSRAILAHINFTHPEMVSKYSINISALDNLLPEVSAFSKGDLLYIDEIGQMELLSDKFRMLVVNYLNSPNPCIATLTSVFNDPFVEEIKRRDDVVLIKLTPDNRAEQEKLINELLSR